MDDLLSEKEQIDQIRSWWSVYGSYVIGGVVIGAGILFGINYYQTDTLRTQMEASSAYETLVEHVDSGDLEASEDAAKLIAESYADTTYAAQAGLAMARLYMEKNRDQDAADALLGVVDSDAEDEMKHVARLRLSRIYLYQGKAQEVVDMLEGQDAPAFAAAYGEVLGDAYTALDRLEEAQASYQEVLLDPLSEGTVDRQLVQWKALDLPETAVVTPDVGEPEPEVTVETQQPVSEDVE